MGSIFSSNKEVRVPEDDFKALKESTTYTSGEILHLYKRYLYFTGNDPTKHLSRRLILQSTELAKSNPISVFILDAMFKSKKRIDFLEFAKFLHLFRAPTKLLETEDDVQARTTKKIELLFDMLDIGSDNSISKDELTFVLNLMFSDHMDSLSIQKIVDVWLDELDTSKMNQIFYADYYNALKTLEVDERLMMTFPSQ